MVTIPSPASAGNFLGSGPAIASVTVSRNSPTLNAVITAETRGALRRGRYARRSIPTPKSAIAANVSGTTTTKGR